MTRCRKCGRILRTHPVYGDARVYGPTCWRRLRPAVAALQASGNRAAEGAAQILLDGALVRLRGHRGRVWRVVSSDGSRQYLVAPEADNCKAGLYSKLCMHKVAVTIMLAA